jgi:hypothetical protein
MTDKWYIHIHPNQYVHKKMLVLWNQAVHTQREVTANMPDIINENKKEKTRILIDVAIPGNRNVMQKEVE